MVLPHNGVISSFYKFYEYGSLLIVLVLHRLLKVQPVQYSLYEKCIALEKSTVSSECSRPLCISLIPRTLVY